MGDSLCFCCGVVDVETLLWNIRCGLFVVEVSLWNLRCGIFVVE